MSKRPGECQVLSQVCVDHGSLLITHDDKYAVENLRREGTPSFPAMQWSLPLRGENLPDALAGGQPEFAVRVRPVSKVEPTPPLRKPTWSTCTLPVVLMADYPYNIRTFIAQLLTDALFMDTSGAASGGAQPGLLEVRGCGWGTRQAAEANEAQDAMAALLSKGGDTGPLFFALNVEDPSQCSPPNYEAELSAAAAGAAAANTQQQGKEQQQQQQPQAPQGRLDRATAAVRDQHVTLRPASLIAMIKQVAPYLHDRGAYARGRTEGGTHGYVTAEGVVVGPPGVADVAAFAAGKPVLK